MALTNAHITLTDTSWNSIGTGFTLIIIGAVNGEFYSVSYNYNNLSTIGTVDYSYAINAMGKLEDTAKNVELINKKINDLDIKIKELLLRLETL